MSKNLKEFLDSGQYLPEPLKDFHDQKHVFKAIHTFVSKHDVMPRLTWVDAHMYTIDVFLWFMAKRGWTLQRSRQKIEFFDLQEDINELDELETASLKKILGEKT